MSSSKSYVSGSHANWENIQVDSFTGWINQQLYDRNLVIKDLVSDFCDGVMLINLIEVLSGKKVPRYVRSPKFLQHKIDNVLIALAFMERHFDIKVVGCNAKDIVDGNLKQILGVSFLLMQKMKTNAILEGIDPVLAATLGGASSSASKRHTVMGSTSTPVQRFAHRVFAEPTPGVVVTSVPSSDHHSYASQPDTTTTGVSVNAIRERFTSMPTARLDTTSNNIHLQGAGSSSAPATPPVAGHALDRGVLRKTKSGALIGGSFETLQFANKELSINTDKLLVVQSIARGWLARRRWSGAITKYRALLRSYDAHFATNAKAMRGLCRVQARTKGRIERRRLWRAYPLFRRNEIIKEIMNTERKYVRCLDTLIECYLKESEKIITSQQVRSIFSQVEVIRNVNSNILGQMENRFKKGSEQQLGEIFKKMTEFLKVYTNYVNNYNTSFQTITECMENDKFVKLIEHNRTLEKCMGLDLSAFLIMPIQRLPRYVMLLQDLFKFTSETHPDYENLSIALKKMKDVAEYVNERKREAENLNQVLTIQKSLTGRFENLAEPHRRYVRKGPLTCLDDKGAPKTYFFFLFNDLLVKTENKALARQLREAKNPRATLSGDTDHKFKFIVSYRLDGASLVDLADSASPYSFQLLNVGINSEISAFGSSSGGVHGVGNSAITLTAFSTGEKMTWISDIDETISQLLEKTRSKKRALISEYDELTSTPYEAPIKDAEMSGLLHKQHNQLGWKPRQFFLKAGMLYYHTIHEDTKPKKMKCINLILCSVKLVQVPDHPHCFQLITPLRIYFLSCPEGHFLFLWISLIRSSIVKKLESLTEVDETTQANEVLSDPSNQTCADCGATEPSWVSTTFGVVLCVECSAIHRHLPGAVSQVKSLRGLSTTNICIEGNAKANLRLEKHLPANVTRPHPKEGYESRLTYIHAKYLPNNPPCSPGEIRKASIRMGSSPIQLTGSLSGTPTTLTMSLSDSLKLHEHATPPQSPSKVASSEDVVVAESTPVVIADVQNEHTPIVDTSATTATTPETSTTLIDESTPIATTSTTLEPTNDNNDSETNQSITSNSNTSTPSITSLTNSINNEDANNHSNNPNWKAPVQPPTFERKKSIFLDKPRSASMITPIEKKKDHEGFLLKTSSPSKSSNWKKYMFIYRDGHLNYYKISKTGGKKSLPKKPRGTIDLTEFYSIKIAPKPKQQFSFTLITRYRLYFFATETEEELKSWVEILEPLGSAIPPPQ
eukprot:gene11983-13990_t